MPDTKGSQLPDLTSLTLDDVIIVVDSPSGNPSTRKISFANFRRGFYKATSVNNSNYSATSEDIYIIQSGSMSASRTITLPNASSVLPGWRIRVGDTSGTVNSTNVIQIVKNGADTVNGSSGVNISTPYGSIDFISDGVSKWSYNASATSGMLGANNLSELTNFAQARTNLGLGNASIANIGTTSGTVAAGDDSRFTALTGAAQKSANLSDLTNVATARTNLGLGSAAVANIGTGAGTVAAGDDSRVSGAMQKSANLSDLGNNATARLNLGLGSIVTFDTNAVEVFGWTTFANANTTITNTTRAIMQNGTLSASRTVTLPAANSVPAGASILVGDISGSVNSTNKLIISRAGTDNVNGVNTIEITEAYGQRLLKSNGSNAWYYDAGINRGSGGGGGGVASGFALGITYSQIPNYTIGSDAFMIMGNTSIGDGGQGAIYKKGTSSGPRAIADNSGQYYELVMGMYVDIRWFGARMTSGQDDATIFQTAINSMPGYTIPGSSQSAQCILYIPAGSLWITGGITIAKEKKIHITGAGMGQTFIRALGSASGDMITVNCSDFTIDNLCIQGTFLGANSTGENNGLVLAAAYCKVRDVLFSYIRGTGLYLFGSGSGPTAVKSSGNHISGVRMRYIGGRGLHLSSSYPNYDSYISNIDIGITGKAGVYDQVGANNYDLIHVWSCGVESDITNPAQYGDTAGLWFQGSNIVCTGGQSETNRGAGILIGGVAGGNTSRVTITGGNNWGNRRAGLELYNANGAVITGGVYRRNGLDNTTQTSQLGDYAGILLKGNTHSNTIVANNIADDIVSIAEGPYSGYSPPYGFLGRDPDGAGYRTQTYAVYEMTIIESGNSRQPYQNNIWCNSMKAEFHTVASMGYNTVSLPSTINAPVPGKLISVNSRVNHNDYGTQALPVYASASGVAIGAGWEMVLISGTTQINFISTTYNEREITLLFQAAGCIVQHNASLRLSGQVDYVSIVGSTLTLRQNGAIWYETGRSNSYVAPPPPNVQVFTTTGTNTWTKPTLPGYTLYDVWGVSAGGGGGSGRRGAIMSARYGGAGGAGGGFFRRIGYLSDLSATETVTVGAGGTGGAAVTVDSTNGNNGTAGGTSWFKSTAWVRSFGGGGGLGGLTTASTTSAGGAGNTNGGAGAAPDPGMGAGVAGTAVGEGGCGAGSGGSMGMSDAFTAGGAGNSQGSTSNAGGAGGATAGASGGNGVNNDATLPQLPGTSGGGGASGGASAAGGTGGNGGYGSGGGGGGASINGQASGAGGNGGNGFVVVICR